MRKKSYRMERVNALLQKLLSETIFAEYDAAKLDLVTITAVDTQRDLKQAKIFLTASNNIEKHVRALNNMSLRLRALIKPRLDFKTVPEFKFIEDIYLDSIMNIESYLDRSNNDHD